MTQPLPPTEADDRRRRIGIALVLGAFTLGGFYLLWVVAADLRDYRAATSWPNVAADVISASIEDLPGAADGADGFGVVLRYRYQVNGQTYESDRLRREGGERFTTREAAEEVLRGYLPGDGRTVTARYDPADPGTAVLSIGPPIYLLLFVAFYWAILLVFLIPAVRAWWAVRQADDRA